MAMGTIRAALSAMRRLNTTSATRLKGIHLDDDWRIPALRSGAADWPADLNTALTARTTGTVTGDTPAYVVFSDGFPVCWLTYDAATIAAPANLSRNQTKHRDLALQALADLTRHALGRLADLRDVRDGRPADVDNGYHEGRVGMARVAAQDRPTRAWWVPVGADRCRARRRIGETTGVDADQTLILAAYGYGDYGRHADRIDLDVLRAIATAAENHHLPAAVVGDWLATEGGLHPGQVPADDVVPAFTAAFVGVFSHELGYTAFRVAELGWKDQLRRLGMSEFFDEAKFNRHLFGQQVRAITNPGQAGGIVVCRRAGHR
jgi:hypothetical protein